jgi:hypothetical protein
MRSYPIQDRSGFNRLSDFRRLWGKRIDERIRQFPLKLDFLEHGLMPPLHGCVESFHHTCTIGAFTDPVKRQSSPQGRAAVCMVCAPLCVRLVLYRYRLGTDGTRGVSTPCRD